MKTLWTYDQLSQRMGVNVHTLRYWVKKEQLPGAMRLGKKTVRFDADIVEAWLKAKAERSGQ